MNGTDLRLSFDRQEEHPIFRMTCPPSSSRDLGDVDAVVIVVITRRDLSSLSIADGDRYLSEHEIRDRSE